MSAVLSLVVKQLFVAKFNSGSTILLDLCLKAGLMDVICYLDASPFLHLTHSQPLRLYYCGCNFEYR